MTPGEMVPYEADEVLPALPVHAGAGEVDIQVATAHRFPRSLTAFRRDLLTEATADAETAGSMFYTLKRGGKSIEGPSARFAEAALSAWGNLRVIGEIESEDADFVYASATAWDLEKNVAVRVRTRRRIRDRDGTRYGIDMIGTTGAAATSIAIRNAGLKVIPRSAWWAAYVAARSASLGKGTIEEKRAHALEWFARNGAQPQAVYDYLDVAGADDIGEAELIELRGLRTAIEDGETTVERAFARTTDTSDAATLNASLATPTDATNASAPTPAPVTPPSPPAEPAPPARKRATPRKPGQLPKAPESLGAHPTPPSAVAETIDVTTRDDTRHRAVTVPAAAPPDPAEAAEPPRTPTTRPFLSREELLARAPSAPEPAPEPTPSTGPALPGPLSAAAGVGMSAPREPELVAAAGRYRAVLEEYRPAWTLRNKRMFEESTLGEPQARWTSVLQYDRAIEAILDAVATEGEAAGAGAETRPAPPL